MLTSKQSAQAAQEFIRHHKCDLEINRYEKQKKEAHRSYLGQARQLDGQIRKVDGQRETIFQGCVNMLLGWDTEWADSQTIESAIRQANGKVDAYLRKAIQRALAAVMAIKEQRNKKPTEPKNPRTDLLDKPKKKQKDVNKAMDIEKGRQTQGDDFAAKQVEEQIRAKFREVFEIIEINSDFTNLDKASVIWQEMVVERKVHLRGGGKKQRAK